MNFWFTSDYHLGHANIIQYCKRPVIKENDLDKDGNWINEEIANLRCEEMNKIIIRNHNQRVKEDDTVFFLGDFCFRNTAGGKEGEGNLVRAKEYLKQLNGNFVFIQGNHDNNNSLKAIIKSAIIHLGGQDIFLTHNPENYENSIRFNFVGHVHNAWKIRKMGYSILINVGCDVWNFMPIGLKDIQKELSKQKIKW